MGFRRGSRRPAAAERSRRPGRRPDAAPGSTPDADSVARSSPGGIAVDSVATRVNVTVCATPGTVSSRPSAAAAAAKAGTPGHDFVVDAEPVETPALLGQRAVQRRVARMQPRDIQSGRVRVGDLVDDLVECQRPGVDHPGVRRTERQQVVGHDRARVQAHRATAQQPLPAHGDQVGGARARTDEVDGHPLVTTHCVTGIAGRQPVNSPSGSPR